MLTAGECYLVADDPEAHGAFGKHTEIHRKVFCTEYSVGRTEMLASRSQGLQPECVLYLTQAFEYHEEQRVIYKNHMYEIIRTYKTPTDGIELTIQRSNAVPEEVHPDV